MALFGRSQAKSLVEFRAGKMNFNTTTKMVSPRPRPPNTFSSAPQTRGDQIKKLEEAEEPSSITAPG